MICNSRFFAGVTREGLTIASQIRDKPEQGAGISPRFRAILCAISALSLVQILLQWMVLILVFVGRDGQI